MLARYDELDMLREENRQLKDKIAQLEGRSQVEAARKTFKLTNRQAKLLVLIARRGIVDRGMCFETVYEDKLRAAGVGSWPAARFSISANSARKCTLTMSFRCRAGANTRPATFRFCRAG